jgi:GNAT superfamily N-acetyltransferase
MVAARSWWLTLTKRQSLAGLSAAFSRTSPKSSGCTWPLDLETVARELGATRIVLETGPRQPEAIALYHRAGFADIPLFGDYLDSPHPELSVCMEKIL